MIELKVQECTYLNEIAVVIISLCVCAKKVTFYSFETAKNWSFETAKKWSFETAKNEVLKLQKNEVLKLQKIEVLKLQEIEAKKRLFHIS